MSVSRETIVVSQEENLKTYRKYYLPFRAKLLETPSLYLDKDTFYVRMRFAKRRISSLYNKISNEVLAYVDKLNTTVHAEYTLTESSINFSIYDGNVARTEISKTGSLVLYLALDPSRYSFKDRNFERIDEESEYGQLGYRMKITVSEKDGNYKDDVCVKYVRDMMKEAGCIKDFEYGFCDYASFFRREVLVANKQYSETTEEGNANPRPDMMFVITSETLKNVQNSDVIHIELDDDPNFVEEKNEEYSKPKEENFSHLDELIKTYGGDTKELEVKQTPVVKVEKKPENEVVYDQNKKGLFYKQRAIWAELAEYGYTFLTLQKLLFYAGAIAISFALGMIFQLKWWALLIVMVFSVLTMPFVVSAFYKNKYEAKRFRDVESYIEQMLYSFRRNGKILSALRDTLVIFPNGRMHNQITRAISYIRETNRKGNPYVVALKYIEDAFPCRRIRTLHRYIIKVEGAGGNHDVGVDALVKDRRLWIDRIDTFRKQYAATHREVIISVLFSLAVSAFMVIMLPTDAFRLSDNMIYQIVTIIMIMANIAVVAVVYSKTILSISEGDTVNPEKTIRKIKWLRKYDKKTERLRALKQSAIGLVLVVFGILLGKTAIWVMGIVLTLFMAVVYAPLQKRSATKSVCREIEKIFPDWLLELALLLQNDNLHVAIEKTIDDAPEILREEIRDLADNIMSYPNDFSPYAKFFAEFNVESVHSSMRLLYSIAEFGSQDELYQLSELVERNNKLMDQAERYRNEDKVSAVFMLKFLPSLSVSIKMMVDMMVFLMTYMSVLI